MWERENIAKGRFLVWLAIHDRLKTRTRLQSMGINMDMNCPICDNADETINHLFFECVYSSKCYQAIHDWIGVNNRRNTLKDICLESGD